jgi:hypothetical protein
MQFLESTELLAMLKAAKARSNRDWEMLLLAYATECELARSLTSAWILLI